MKVASIIPTYNEFDFLRKCVFSLNNQKNIDSLNLDIYIINAGQKLPFDIAELVHEEKVPDNYYWGASIEYGFSILRKKDYDFVMIGNADALYSENFIAELVKEVKKDTNIVACSPCYRPENDKLILEYSYIEYSKILCPSYAIADWATLCEAISLPYTITIGDGKAALFSADYLNHFSVDYKNFPQHGADIDLFFKMKKNGLKFIMVPSTYVVDLNRYMHRKYGTNGMKTLFHIKTWILFYFKNLPIYSAFAAVLLKGLMICFPPLKYLIKYYYCKKRVIRPVSISVG